MFELFVLFMIGVFIVGYRHSIKEFKKKYNKNEGLH